MEEDESTVEQEIEPGRGTDPTIKATLQELIRLGYLEEARKPALFRNAVLHETALRGTLEPLDFGLRLDTSRGLALLTMLPSGGDDDLDDEWKHPLVRRQRLTLEQSILVALLREIYLMHEQERGIGESNARVAVEDLLPKFLTYLPDSGSDNRNQTRLSSILDQLKSHGIVSEIDKNNEVVIRPLIVHLANAESLEALLKTYQTHVEPE